MIAKKNILIIGGTGFIGYHLAKQSLQKGWKVTSISSKLPKKIRYLKKVKYLRCDITKKKLLKEKIKKNFDYVVNLGGYVDHTNKKKTFKSHYQGCKNLTEIFLKKKPISFIQIGSSLEYGNSNSPQKENIKCNLKSIKSIYGKAKLLASFHVIDLFKKKNFPSTVIRFYLVSLSIFVIYLFGVPWLAYLSGWETAYVWGIKNFILAEIVKISILVLLTEKLLKFRKFI